MRRENETIEPDRIRCFGMRWIEAARRSNQPWKAAQAAG
jgi:hypothetical protein